MGRVFKTEKSTTQSPHLHICWKNRLVLRMGVGDYYEQEEGEGCSAAGKHLLHPQQMQAYWGMSQPDTQESFYSSFSTHHSSLLAEAQQQAGLHQLAAVEAAAAPAHAAEPTAAAASAEPLSCSAQELHCYPFAAAGAAVASAAHAIRAPFDAQP